MAWTSSTPRSTSFIEDAAPYRWDQALYADPALAGMVARFQARVAHGSTEAMRAEMDAQGVQGALVVAPAIHGHEPSYSVDAYRRHPDRFRVVGRVDATRDDIEDALSAWGAHPAFVGRASRSRRPRRSSGSSPATTTGCWPRPGAPACGCG